MKQKAAFGLIGKGIAYSFSQKYFEEKFNKLFLAQHQYNLFDIPSIDDLRQVLATDALKGLNVTIPYKEQVIPFLDALSPEAQYIQAVNTIKLTDGKLVGHNTDAFGFEKTLLVHLKPQQKKALILGNGGAAKAVKYVLEKHQIAYQVVARQAELNFENLSADLVAESSIIIQTTPVGTFPNVAQHVPFPFEALGSGHLVIDLIYNPAVTAFLAQAAAQGVTTANGLYMLEQQAEKAWEIWNASV
jgi:shikimate dehydrogenase